MPILELQCRALNRPSALTLNTQREPMMELPGGTALGGGRRLCDIEDFEALSAQPLTICSLEVAIASL